MARCQVSTQSCGQTERLCCDTCLPEPLQAALAGTLAGALGVLAPLWEGADGAALLRLQALLALALPHAAGLNPAAFGCARLEHVALCQRMSGGRASGKSCRL